MYYYLIHLMWAILIRSFGAGILSVINGIGALICTGRHNNQGSTYCIDFMILVLSMGFMPYFFVSIFTSISWLQLIIGTLITGLMTLFIGMIIFCGATRYSLLINDNKILASVYSLEGFFVGVFLTQFLAYYVGEVFMREIVSI